MMLHKLKVRKTKWKNGWREDIHVEWNNMNENERHKEGKCFEGGTKEKTERKEEK